MQEASEIFQIKSDLMTVSEMMHDVQRLGSCIPGVKEVTVLSPEDSQWKMTIVAGIISQTLNFRVHFSNIAVDSISFAGEGSNLNFAGSLQLQAVEAKVTEAAFNLKIDAHGPIGRLVDLYMGHIAERLSKESVENIKSKLESIAHS